MSITVRQLNQKEIGEFIKFEWQIYSDDAHWVPHLLMERKEFLDPHKNPFFDHADVAYFMAYRNGQAVGRIAGIVNELHNKFHQDQTGFFGLFECRNDPDAAAALIGEAEKFVRQRGMTVLRGPVNFSTNDECGLLVEGFDRPPMIMMTYNPTYYIALFEQNGLVKCKDLIAYRLETPPSIPERLQRAVDLILKRNSFTVRTFNMKDFTNEVQRVKKIYNAAWEKNWGFIPMTDAEFDHMGKQMKQILDPDFLFIAEHRGEPIGFSLAIPNINEALIKIRDGRLLPFGLFKLLWNTRKGKIRTVRVITLGVVPQHRHSGLDTVFYHKTFEMGIRKGVQWGELSWILEDNAAMNRPLERMGATVYKRYRIYEKAVSA